MNFENKKPASEFLPALESSRGIAAFLVVVFHYSQIRNLTGSFYLAVDFFFILSGFIMAKIYYGKISNRKLFAKFLILRLGRIYPLHLFWFFIYLISFLITQKGQLNSDQIDSILPTISLLNSAHLIDKPTSFNLPSWSISAEWISYLLFGLHMLCFSHIQKGINTIFCLLIILFSYFAVFSLHPQLGLDVTFEAGFLRGIGGFYFGILGFLITQKFQINIKILKWFFLLMVIFLFLNNPRTYTDYLFPPLALFLVIGLSGYEAQKSFLSNPFLVWVGTVSYSVYLGHGFIGGLTHRIYTNILHLPYNGYHSYILFSLKIILCYIVAHLTYKLIERPFRQKTRSLVS
jgi:peptidoglycan/LPS O-acetylase OafA/YrhL